MHECDGKQWERWNFYGAGWVILNCGNKKGITSTQNTIQKNLGEEYKVKIPKIYERRIKVVGVNESEHNNSEENIIEKLLGRITWLLTVVIGKWNFLE